MTPPIPELTSRENDQVKYLKKLLEKPSFARQEGVFVAQGAKLCCTAAESGIAIKNLYCTRQAAKRWPQVFALGCPVVWISEPVADKLSGMPSAQGAFALCEMPQFSSLDIDPAGYYIALESVQDPANLGAVMRSAAAFGYRGVVLSAGCAEPFGQKAMRASMGAVFKLPVIRTEDLPGLLQQLAKRGMTTAAAALRNSADIRTFSPSGGLVLVIGSEGQGLTEQTIAACQQAVRIPIEGMESLNAAVAASILMWEYGGKQRG
ncbi:MAG: RNA methyltransferase [Pygmaiobacter massiliensis]|nr:RNA methyltransferase [Pygmaiobacter massiliensis]